MALSVNDKVKERRIIKIGSFERTRKKIMEKDILEIKGRKELVDSVDETYTITLRVDEFEKVLYSRYIASELLIGGVIEHILTYRDSSKENEDFKRLKRAGLQYG